MKSKIILVAFISLYSVAGYSQTTNSAGTPTGLMRDWLTGELWKLEKVSTADTIITDSVISQLKLKFNDDYTYQTYYDTVAESGEWRFSLDANKIYMKNLDDEIVIFSILRLLPNKFDYTYYSEPIYNDETEQDEFGGEAVFYMIPETY